MRPSEDSLDWTLNLEGEPGVRRKKGPFLSGDPLDHVRFKSPNLCINFGVAGGLLLFWGDAADH